MLTGAIALAIGIGLQNFPEGAAVSTADAGAPDTVGDFVKVKAIFFPSEVSGWYVQNIVAKQ
ncbi:MAG: hypothetical protein ABIK27_09135, partial [Bacteroidota bacterium]